MRIGYDRLETLTGGYIYDKILIADLRRWGHEIEIISLPRRSYARNLFDNLTRAPYLRLTGSCFDLLLQDGLCHPSLFLINKKLRENSPFLVVSILHQVLSSQPRSSLRNAVYRTIEKPYLASVGAFIFNSKSTRSAAAEIIEINQPSTIAYPGGDRLGSVRSKEEINTRAQEKGPLKLLFIGNLLPHKGLLQLIEVLSRLAAEKWQLTIVGSLSMDGAYARQVETLIHQKRLSGRIELTGAKDGSELARSLSRSHLLVMPFSHEGFGMAYLEGMAFGLPAIGSSIGAAKEIIAHRQNGLLVSPGDKENLLTYIQELYEDRHRLSEMSHCAFDTYKAHPKWEDTTARIHTFLCRLANSR
jgi:glycosyltransferase involved in cell wall biosynthesis